MMERERIIMHVDMNAFFASVEQQCNPSLRGKPVAVIGSQERTVITTASYEARAFGVKTGMTKYEGKRLCPGLILVPGNSRKYTDTSARIIAILRKFTPAVEVYSIDEAFMDVTGSLRMFETPENIARLIKEEITEKLGLRCSIGIAPNKLLAKLASDRQKPDGLVRIKKGEVASFLERLPIGALWGIGKRSEADLNSMGIFTCKEMRLYPKEQLKKRFGIIGETLHNMGQGIDDSPVVPLEEEPDAKSIGHSVTLDRDLCRMEDIRRQLLLLSEMVGRRARKNRYSGRTVALTVRYKDFQTFTRRRTFPSFINETFDIYCEALRILGSVKLKQPVRLLGISLSGLTRSMQLPLLAEKRRQDVLVKAVDEINDLYGVFTVTWGSLLSCRKGSRVISPSWRPSGPRQTEVK
jgi:DNA polymerase-4